MKKAMVKKNLLVLLLGFVSALKGSLAVTMVAAAVVAFRGVLTADSYKAVVMFAFGLLDVGLALLLFYCCGHDIVKGKYSK